MPSYAYAVLFCSHFFLKFDNDTAASLLLMSAFFFLKSCTTVGAGHT